MIELKEISILDDNMKECITLDVLPTQVDFVADNAVSLGEAYDVNKAHAQTGKGDVAVPYAVYENGKMVGFAMYGYFPDGDGYTDGEPKYYFWRLMVDKNHQGRGIGREIVRLVMDKIKSKPQGEATYCYSSYVPENIGSKSTFASYGYEEDGRMIDGELVARYKL